MHYSLCSLDSLNIITLNDEVIRESRAVSIHKNFTINYYFREIMVLKKINRCTSFYIYSGSLYPVWEIQKEIMNALNEN